MLSVLYIFLQASMIPLYFGTLESKPCNCNLLLTKSVGYVIETEKTPAKAPVINFVSNIVFLTKELK